MELRIKLDSDLHRAAKILAAQTGLSLKEIIHRALREYIAKIPYLRGEKNNA